MARDDQRVDIRRLVGVQVKAGATPFKWEVTVDGPVTGLSYYERNDHHFEYWSSHSIPHVLALHRIENGSTYPARLVHALRQQTMLVTVDARQRFLPRICHARAPNMPLN